MQCTNSSIICSRYGSKLMRQTSAAKALRRFTGLCAASLHSSESFPPQPQLKVSVLDNGLRVASVSRPYAQTAAVGVWIDTGSRYETKAINGAAHFLEHMAFKGTNRRTRTQLEMEVEDMGAHLNAYTSREQTAYHAKCMSTGVPQAMDILSDILQNSKLEDRAIESEKGVIMREMEEVNKQENELLLDDLHEIGYDGHGLGHTILGPEANIRGMDRFTLVEYIATHYSAQRMVIVGAGGVDHNELVRLAEKQFGGLPGEIPPAALKIGFEAPEFTPADRRRLDLSDPDAEAHVMLCFEGPSYQSPDAIPVMLLRSIIGEWNRLSGIGQSHPSPLARAVSAQGLGHSYSAFNTMYKDTGLFGIHTVSDPSTLPALFESVLKYLTTLPTSTEVLTDEALDRAKSMLRSAALAELDSFTNIAEDVGRQMLVYGRRRTVQEQFDAIGAVSLDDMRSLAHSLFVNRDHCLAALGPVAELPGYEWFREQTRG